MSTRLTLDLGDPQLAQLLRVEAARERTTMKDIVVRALEAYFSERRENGALLKLAEAAFAEWDNPEDAVYDEL